MKKIDKAMQILEHDPDASPRDIAAKFGMSVSTVHIAKKRLHNATARARTSARALRDSYLPELDPAARIEFLEMENKRLKMALMSLLNS